MRIAALGNIGIGQISQAQVDQANAMLERLQIAMSRPKILLVDDSRTIRIQLGWMLSEAGYEVEFASDGAEALCLASENPPALVILDIQMPKMDGYQVCQELKRMGKPYHELPIVFLTTIDSHALDLLGSEMVGFGGLEDVRDLARSDLELFLANVL